MSKNGTINRTFCVYVETLGAPATGNITIVEREIDLTQHDLITSMNQFYSMYRIRYCRIIIQSTCLDGNEGAAEHGAYQKNTDSANPASIAEIIEQYRCIKPGFHAKADRSGAFNLKVQSLWRDLSEDDHLIGTIFTFVKNTDSGPEIDTANVIAEIGVSFR